MKNIYKGLPAFTKESPKGGGIMRKGITNVILKAVDLIEVLKKEEAEVRAKITVLAGKN